MATNSNERAGARAAGWRRLVDAIGIAIVTGRLRPGDRLPTARRLAVSLRVSANAVARAYAELERTGIVEPEPDGGLTVAGDSGWRDGGT